MQANTRQEGTSETEPEMWLRARLAFPQPDEDGAVVRSEKEVEE